MKNSITKIIVLALVSSLLVTGCGKEEQKTYEDMNKEELLEVVNALSQENFDLTIKLGESEEFIKSINGSNTSSPVTTSMTIDTNGSLSFNSYDSKIIFPDEYKYPESTEISNSSSISIVQNITISPNTNWIYRLNGSSLEMEHSTGINALIKVGSIAETYDRNKLLDDVLKPWFSQLTDSNVRYSSIFLNGLQWGNQAKANIKIDGQDAYLVTGMLGFSNYSMTYVFVYRGKEDSTKNDTINQVLNSIKFIGQELTVD